MLHTISARYIICKCMQESDTTEDKDKKAGMVSKRLGLMSIGGEGVTEICTVTSSPPEFIEMQAFERNSTTICQVGEIIELEGPFRPSSYQAMP